MTLNPAVVEKQLVDIDLKGGLNERDRPETLDWTKWLSRAENIVYDDTGALIRRPGLNETLDLSGSGVGISYPKIPLGVFKAGRGIVVDGLGSGPNARILTSFDESNSRLENSGYVPNLSVQSRKTVDAVAYESGGAGRGRRTIMASCSTSDYDILIHQNPYISGGLVTYVIVLTDRDTGAVVRRWTFNNSSESICAGVYESGATKLLMIAVDTVVGTYQAGFVIINVAPASLFPTADYTSTLNASLVTLTTPGVSPGSNIRPIGITAVGSEFQLVTGVVGTTYITRISTASAILAAATIATYTCTGVAPSTSTRLVLCGRDTGTGNMAVKAITASTLAVFATVQTVTMGVNEIARIASSDTQVVNDTAWGVVIYNRLATTAGTLYVPTVKFITGVYVGGGAGGYSNAAGTAKGWVEVSQPFYVAEANKFCVTLAKMLVSSVAAAYSRDTVAGIVGVFDFSSFAGATFMEPVIECVVDQYTASIESNEQEYGYLCTTGTTSSTNVFSIAPYVTNISGRYVVPYIKKSTAFSYGYEQVVVKPYVSSPPSNTEAIMSYGTACYYDNRWLSEFGILDTPFVFARDSGGGTGVNIGLHSWVAVLEARDGNGNVAYSRTSRPTSVTLGAARDVIIDYGEIFGSLRHINKITNQESNISIKFYRTTAGGTVYYFVTSFPVKGDCTSAAISSFTDNYSDTTIQSNHQLFRNPGTPGTPLDRYHALCPRHTIVHKDRVFYCNGGNVYYSSFFVDGEAPWFNPAFFISVPGGSGDITGLASMDGILVIFKDDAVFVVDGDGPPENGGTGTEFSPPRRINTEFGCIDARTIIPLPDGVAYRSSRGLEKLTKSFQVQHPAFGEPVKETMATYQYNGNAFFDSKNGRAVWIVGTGNFLFTDLSSAANNVQTDTVSGGIAVVYDVDASAWSVWRSNGGGFVAGVSARMASTTETYMIDRWLQSGSTYYASLCKQSDTNKTDRSSSFVPITLETGCCRIGSIQSRNKVTDFLFLAKKTASSDGHRVRISAAYDYSDTYSDVKTLSESVDFTDTVEQFCYNLARQNVQSVRFKIEILAPADAGTYPIGNCIGPEILGLTVRLGTRGGEAKLAEANNT